MPRRRLESAAGRRPGHAQLHRRREQPLRAQPGPRWASQSPPQEEEPPQEKASPQAGQREEGQMRSAKLITALVAVLIMPAAVGVASAAALIGFRSVTNSIQEADGTPVNVAGYHPDVKTDIKFNLIEQPNGEKKTDDTVRDVITELPAGFYGN